MRYHEYPITPTQQAANGAMALFVEGHQRENIAQMLVGLVVLQSATVAQVHAAMAFAQSAHQASIAEIEAMFTS